VPVRNVATPAVFLDRDGVINEIIYHAELGIVDSPTCARQLRLLPNAAQGIRLLNRAGYRVIVVSNQPGVAKNHFTRENLDEMNRKMERLLKRMGARLDAVYCCLHHPAGKIKSLRRACACRKPGCGMLLEASSDWNIDLSRSYMVGDGVADIQAGKAAGCCTIFIGNWKCDICRVMTDNRVRPDQVASDLVEAARFIICSGNNLGRRRTRSRRKPN
jgi:D-glycero-D-manno-heptose 1,7-bisphosphate phosphatase